MKFEAIVKSFTKKELPNSEVEFVGEVPAEAVAEYKDAALVHIASELDLPGFRKGHVPPDVALKRIGEVAALEEAVELFIRDFYPELVDTHKLDVVGRPNIRITKLAPGSPVGLTIVTSLYPEVMLPKDWKTLGESIALEKAQEATEEEINKTLEDVRQSRKKDEVVPELNDEFAKSIGAFENLDALKAQIKKGITEEKERKERDARRGKIVDALLEKTTIAVPNIFIESEQDKIMSQMREDVARFGLSFEDYLKQASKTEEGVRNDFRDQATKRAKLQLTLNKIATDEKVEADKEAVDAEMKHALEHFPDANQALVRIHIETVMRNEKVLRMLEGEKDPKNAMPQHDHTH